MSVLWVKVAGSADYQEGMRRAVGGLSIGWWVRGRVIIHDDNGGRGYGFPPSCVEPPSVGRRQGTVVQEQRCATRP